MIDIKNNIDCCGCEACVQACPQNCIAFEKDNEGFLYPKVDSSRCVKCRLCLKVCPMLNPADGMDRKTVHAVAIDDAAILAGSSSGGAFTALAQRTLGDGGVVFGARFNEKWEVVHDFVMDGAELAPFRGSKYVQSRIGTSYKKVANYLKQGRRVLFSGTPCQVSGLKLFLQKDYENLILVDFICHGVPSGDVWKAYLDEMPQPVLSVNFRDKTHGWADYRLKVNDNSEDRYKDAYMRGFLYNLFLRPSCYGCRFKAKGISDITMADFWGVNRHLQDLDSKMGVSLIILNTEKGEEYFKGIGLNSIEVSADTVQDGYYHSAKPHENREAFFASGDKGFSNKVNKFTKHSPLKVIIRRLKSIKK